jgi:NADH dehydrogenase
VVGGGYTGVEAATHLRRYAQRSGKELEIILSEIHPTILAMRPVWMQEYMERQLQELDIEVRTEATVESVSGGVRLTTGEEVTDAIVLWNAGVHASSPLSGGPVELDKKGRIVVDEALRAAQGCYVAGDAARFARSDSDEPLFMSSYFAEQEGIRVAKNLIREVAGSKPERYRPLDYGFVIPLANGRGCGTILGRDLRGKIPILIHHGAGWKRARSPETRWSRLKAVLKEGTGI